MTDIGMWWLKHRRDRALWWYNKLIMPLALWLQKELQLTPGMIATNAVDEILLVCRRHTGTVRARIVRERHRNFRLTEPFDTHLVSWDSPPRPGTQANEVRGHLRRKIDQSAKSIRHRGEARNWGACADQARGAESVSARRPVAESRSHV